VRRNPDRVRCSCVGRQCWPWRGGLSSPSWPTGQMIYITNQPPALIPPALAAIKNIAFGGSVKWQR